MPKLAKSAVGFEHPAKGPSHCSQCVHFEPPDACEIVAGPISRRDWCKKFASREGRRQAKQGEHLNRLSSNARY